MSKIKVICLAAEENMKETEERAAEKAITDRFIRQHAQALKELGGKESKLHYMEYLAQFRENPLKFDKEYERLLRSILYQ